MTFQNPFAEIVKKKKKKKKNITKIKLIIVYGGGTLKLYITYACFQILLQEDFGLD